MHRQSLAPSSLPLPSLRYTHTHARKPNQLHSFTTKTHTNTHANQSALLPDWATLSGNDFFFPTDPATGQSRGFVKKVTVPLCLPTAAVASRGYAFGVCSNVFCA